MKNHRAVVAATGLLCAIAATMAVWSGPLLAASGAMHTSGSVQAQPPHQTAAARASR